RTKPMSGIVVPFVGKANRDTISLKNPKLFDQPIIEFSDPLARQKLNDFFAAIRKFCTISPTRINRVCERDFLRVTGIPSIFGQPDFLECRFACKGRQRWPACLLD